MTIKQRLALLLAIPIAALTVLGVVAYLEAARIEQQIRFVAETQVESLATVGRIQRVIGARRINLRNCIVSENPEECARSREAFNADSGGLSALFQQYADGLVTGNEDARLFREIQESATQWNIFASSLLADFDQGRRERAVERLASEGAPLGKRLDKIGEEWTTLNEDMGRSAGASLMNSLDHSRRIMLAAAAGVILLSGLLGVVVLRSISRPLDRLRSSVETIAKGDFESDVPFTKSTDEIGTLARSVDVLKSGASAMEQQRWVKTNAARVASTLQGAVTVEEFAQRLAAELTPLLGGGIGAVYEADPHAAVLRRVASFGLADGQVGACPRFGEGLVGQCAASVAPATFDGLPPDYLRIASGIGSAPPTFAGAWPLLVKGSPIGVFEFAAFRPIQPREQDLLDELLPVAAISLDLLKRNLRTHDLLSETQKQASELQAQQETLRASEEQFRTLLESAPDALIISDEAGQIILVNAQTEKLLGYRRDELVGQMIEMLVPERIRAAHPGMRRRYHADAGVRPMGTGMELAAVRKDGTEFPVEISLSPLRTRDRGTCVVSSMRDITARKRLEQAVRISEERSRRILESTAEGIFGVDTEGRITFVNPAACQLLGFAEHELIGQPSHALIHHHRPDGTDYPVVECPMYAAYKRGEASRIDTEYLWRKDGTGLSVEYGATPIVKDGTIVGAVISFSDITARKHAETEIKRVNFLSDSALELTKAGYWHVPLDDSGRYTSSERAARIFGDLPSPGHRYRLDEWAAHVREGDEAAAKITMENFAAAVAGKIPVYDATYAYKRPIDGRVVWIHALGHVVKDADGKPTDMFGVTQDITEFKHLETDLRTAKKTAEEATVAKSAFLANMSHEIRTPMNGIMGMTELALDTDLTAEQRDYLNTVKSSADALLSLINDILDFSKIEAGRIELDPVEFLLRDSIGDTLSPLSLRASTKGVELAYDVHPDVPDALVGDVYRLRQVMVNLVGNAIKFTEKGEVVLSVGVAERSGDDVTLAIAVRDTGIGISPEAAARLFKAFEQAESSTTRKYGGTGLGLAISKQLVELMGGEIRLDSTPGVGSTFTFTIRMKVGVARPQASAEDAARVFKEKTALIVDDNHTNRRILETMLRHWGLKTMQVDSGKAAMTALDRANNAGQPVSLVITDLHMPEMDGFELTHAIRSHPAFGALPVMLLTSSGSAGDQARCAELGVAARLLKPVKQSLLLDNIMRVLTGADRRGAAAAPVAAGSGPALPRKGLRVLLAEDNAINQKFAVRVLEGAGHSVVLANNGREAVEHSGSQEFDIVLMDVQMPEMDGLDATRAIRAREHDSDGRLPIIAMTANAMKGDREMCMGAGMNGYVPKPVKKEILFAEIERVLKETGRGADVQ